MTEIDLDTALQKKDLSCFHCDDLLPSIHPYYRSVGLSTYMLFDLEPSCRLLSLKKKTDANLREGIESTMIVHDTCVVVLARLKITSVIQKQ